LDALGRHILLEAYGCDVSILNDTHRIKEVLTEAALLADAHIVGAAFHQFNPHGVSGVIIIAESHISIHTWPEYGYAAIDIFTCGEDLKCDIACKHIITEFKSSRSAIVELKRGIVSAGKVIDPVEMPKAEVFA